MEGAFWCSGTLNMLGVDQKPTVVFNPYSYYELQSNLAGLDAYLKCTSTIGMGEEENMDGETCESKRPYIKDLENQGVSSIAVLTRCKANYAASQWDEGTAVLLQPDAVFERLTGGKARQAGLLWRKSMITDIDSNAIVTKELKDCIKATFDAGQPPDACLTDIFLKSKKREDYFMYETTTGNIGESMLVDACEVHTGAARQLAARGVNASDNEFQKCLDNDLETQCNVPNFVWSGRSSGKTPVANYHSWADSDALSGAEYDSQKKKRALIEFAAISKKIAETILAVNDTFNKEGITAELFSAEGKLSVFLFFSVFREH